jgi:hypothetical protein
MAAPRTIIRTCIACRREADKRELVRIVRGSDGETHVDPTGKASGRGASLCPDLACFEAAVNKKRLAPALRATLGEEDVERLRREFEAALENNRATISRHGR